MKSMICFKEEHKRGEEVDKNTLISNLAPSKLGPIRPTLSKLENYLAFFKQTFEENEIDFYKKY